MKETGRERENSAIVGSGGREVNEAFEREYIWIHTHVQNMHKKSLHKGITEIHWMDVLHSVSSTLLNASCSQIFIRAES